MSYIDMKVVDSIDINILWTSLHVMVTVEQIVSTLFHIFYLIVLVWCIA